MKATKITHRNEARIRVDFPYNQEVVSKLRQISDTRWSKTMGAWHVPYTKEAFVQLKTLFPELEYETTATVVANSNIKAIHDLSLPDSSRLNIQATESKPIEKQPKNEVRFASNSIEIEITTRQISIKIPKNETDIQFIRSFKYARWNSAQFCWTMPNFGNNVEKLKGYFGERDVEFIEHTGEKLVIDVEHPSFTKNEMLVVNHSGRKLKVYFGYQINNSHC
ncbi:MAG TPA: hypothetical protein VI413_04510 [Paludibacter sp.]